MAGVAFLTAVLSTSAARSEPKSAAYVGPATCDLWNGSRPRSTMREAMSFWVQTYLSQERRSDVLRGYKKRDIERLLNEHCGANPADNIQTAANALEQKLTPIGSVK